MNDRLITALGALGALAVVWLLFFNSGGEIPVTWPLSNERGRNGYQALAEWLETEGVPVVSWRERFDRLLDEPSGLAPGGNVLLMTMPQRFPLREREQQQIAGWIRRGNTLLILAALNDSPEWLAALPPDGNGFLPTLSALTELRIAALPGIDTTNGQPIETQHAAAGDTVTLQPVAQPLMEGVGEVRGLSDDESAKWFVMPLTQFADRPYLRLAIDARSDSDAVWQIPLEDGRILFFASGSLFANHLIAGSDAPRLVSNILAWHLGPDGSVIFDDMHQGLSSLYDPAAFYADSRLHMTIGFLLAGWFIYVLGASNRVAPIREGPSEPRQSDLLAGIGGFMARRLARHDAGRKLFDEWFREIRTRRGLSDAAEAPWTALAASPTLKPALIARLREDFNRLNEGHAVDLVGLHNRIRRARKAIG